MVKVTDMFRIAIWKFYYKLRNNLLPPYFNYMKPNLPVICNHYNVRNQKFHLPLIKHEFAKQLLQYCLIKLLNEDENASQIAYKVGEQPFCTFKSVIKYKIISSYNNTCIDTGPTCTVQLIQDLHVHYSSYKGLYSGIPVTKETIRRNHGN